MYVWRRWRGRRGAWGGGGGGVEAVNAKNYYSMTVIRNEHFTHLVSSKGEILGRNCNVFSQAVLVKH